MRVSSLLSPLSSLLYSYPFLQGKECEQRDCEFGDDQNRGHRAEFGVHRHVVDEEVGKRHEIPTPREQDTQHGCAQECPFHRSFHDEGAEDEEHQHEGTHIDRSGGHRLFTEILAQLLIEGFKLRVSLRHCRLTVGQRFRGTALGVRHEQRPRLVDAVTPLRDIVAVETARSLVGRIFLHQFTLSAHRLLTVFPRMVEVRDVECDTDSSTHGTGSRSLDETRKRLFPDGLHQIGNDHEEYREQEIIGHLHVVGIDFKRRENGRDEQSPQEFPSVGKHHTGNHRRQIGQRPHLPDVSGSDDDEEITGESPYDGTEDSHPPTEVEGPQQDIEAQEIDEHVPHVFGQPQVIGFLGLSQGLRALVRRCHLVGGHTTEEGICPTGHLARALAVLRLLLSGTYTGRRVMTKQHLPVDVGREEISE